MLTAAKFSPATSANLLGDPVCSKCTASSLVQDTNARRGSLKLQPHVPRASSHSVLPRRSVNSASRTDIRKDLGRRLRRLSIVVGASSTGDGGAESEEAAGEEDQGYASARQSSFSTAKVLFSGALESSNGSSSSSGREPSSPTGGAGSPSSPGHRPGLYRTPVSGGVQSATSSHKLPHPAVAVRNLIESARYAHLCTVMSRMHHRRRGYPFGSLVDFASDEFGYPIFSLSPLAIHTRNLLADPRCTLVVQIPGWSGLANARVTLFGDVYPLPAEQQEWAQKLYSSKNYHGASQQWGNFYFYRMENISDIYFVGGFGTVAWVDVQEYMKAKPDCIASHGAEDTLQELNDRFSKELQRLMSDGDKGVDDACLISIDSKGVDIRVRQGTRFNVQRVSFDEHVETLDEAAAALSKIVKAGSQINR